MEAPSKCTDNYRLALLLNSELPWDRLRQEKGLMSTDPEEELSTRRKDASPEEVKSPEVETSLASSKHKSPKCLLVRECQDLKSETQARSPNRDSLGSYDKRFTF